MVSIQALRLNTTGQIFGNNSVEHNAAKRADQAGNKNCSIELKEIAAAKALICGPDAGALAKLEKLLKSAPKSVKVDCAEFPVPGKLVFKSVGKSERAKTRTLDSYCESDQKLIRCAWEEGLGFGPQNKISADDGLRLYKYGVVQRRRINGKKKDRNYKGPAPRLTEAQADRLVAIGYDFTIVGTPVPRVDTKGSMSGTTTQNVHEDEHIKVDVNACFSQHIVAKGTCQVIERFGQDIGKLFGNRAQISQSILTDANVRISTKVPGQRLLFRGNGGWEVAENATIPMAKLAQGRIGGRRLDPVQVQVAVLDEKGEVVSHQSFEVAVPKTESSSRKWLDDARKFLAEKKATCRKI